MWSNKARACVRTPAATDYSKIDFHILDMARTWQPVANE